LDGCSGEAVPARHGPRAAQRRGAQLFWGVSGTEPAGPAAGRPLLRQGNRYDLTDTKGYKEEERRLNIFSIIDWPTA